MASAFLVEYFIQMNVFVWMCTNHECVCLDMHGFFHLIIGYAIRYPRTGNLRYHSGCHLVSWSQRIKYLGIIITSKLKWKDQYQFIVSKATKHLNSLYWTMFGYT